MSETADASTSAAVPGAAPLPAPASWRCTANAVFLLCGFRLGNGQTPAGSPELGAAARDLRKRLMSRSWADFEATARAAEGAGTVAASPTGESGSGLWRSLPRSAARKRIHQDLMPVVDHLLNGGPQEPGRSAPGAYQGLAPLLLLAPKLLGQQAFALQLSAAARQRLARAGIGAAEADRLGLRLDGAALHFMASGMVVLALQMRLLSLGLKAPADERWKHWPDTTPAEKAARKAAAERAKVQQAEAEATLPHALLEEGLYALGHASDRGQVLQAVRVGSPRPGQAALQAGTWVVNDPAAQHALREATEAERSANAQVDPTSPRPASQAPMQLHLDIEAGGSSPILLRDPLGAMTQERLIGALLGLPDEAWRAHQAPATDADEDEPEESAEPGPAAARAKRDPAELTPIGSGPHGRRFMMCAAKYDGGTPDAELPRLAYGLSRRYGSDYLLAEGDIRSSTVLPFHNVCHAMATQGAALVVRDTGVAFIQDFISAAVPATYLPLAVLNYHEYLQLLHLTQECAFMPDVADPARDSVRLSRLRSSLAAFRLYFRFSHVSDLAHHNRVHRAWREALDLDRMLQEVTLDVREAEQVMAAIHEKAEEARRAEHKARAARWKNIASFGVAGASIVAVYHLLEMVLGYLYPQKQWSLQMLRGDNLTWAQVAAKPEFQEAMRLYHEAHRLELWFLVAAVALGGLLGFFTHKSGGGGGAGH